LYGVDADRLEQLGIILAHALDPHAIGKVRPAQDGLLIDADFAGKLFAPLGALCSLEQLCRRPYTYFSKLLRHQRANSFDVHNCIGHEALPMSSARAGVPRKQTAPPQCSPASGEMS